MFHRTARALLLAIAASALLASSASAWSGGQITKRSCPELHFYAPPERTPWRIAAIDGVVRSAADLAGKTVLWSADVQGSQYEQARGDVHFAGVHTVTFVLGNAANMADGFVAATPIVLGGCDALTGPPGPAGPAGPQGPAGPAGPPGTTTTLIVHQAPKACTSKRSYRFHVAREFYGVPVTAAKLGTGEKGVRYKLRRSGDRFVVSWSTKGKKYPRGGSLQSVTVRVWLADGREFNTNWQYRPCSTGSGNLNDPPSSAPSS